jgi:hypothetical protein
MRDGGDGMNLDKSSIGAHEVCVGRGSSMCNSKVVSFCCLLVLSAGSVSAQTAGISAASTFVAGQTVTIQGAGFGVKTTPAPLYFWDFGNGATQSSSLSRSAYADVIRGTLSNSLTAPNSKTALQVDMGGVETAAGPTNGVKFTSTTMYVWIKHLYDFDIMKSSGANGFNLKTFRLWYPWTHSTYTFYQSKPTQSGASAERTQNGSVWLHMMPQKGVWQIDEYDYQAGGVGVQNGIFQYTRNGILGWEPSTRFLMRSSSLQEQYNILFFDQVSNNQVAPGTFQYIDSIYVDDTRQRVIVSTEPTWRTQVNTGSIAEREVQIPLTWTDSQIEFIARQGSLNSFAGKYLYVIDADGNPISTKGFAITSGAGANAAPSPSAPVAVTVH